MSSIFKSIEISRARIPLAKIDMKRAGNGNRTRMASLEGWNFTIKLCPRAAGKLPRAVKSAKRFLRRAHPCYFGTRCLAIRTMKIAGVSLLCGICFISFARADLTIVQKVEGPGQSGDVTIKIKGEKERIDAASQPTRIIDGKTGEMLNRSEEH